MRAFPEGISAREAGYADAAAWSLVLDEGFESYVSFAAEGWRPPTVGQEVKDGLARHLDGPDAWGLLASGRDGAPAGIASISTIVRVDAHPAPPGSGHLWHLFVRPAWQGSGLAGALLDRVFLEARERGFGHLVLWTPSGQAQARRFYEREGFALTGAKQFNEEIGLDLVQYRRALP